TVANRLVGHRLHVGSLGSAHGLQVSDLLANRLVAHWITSMIWCLRAGLGGFRNTTSGRLGAASTEAGLSPSTPSSPDAGRCFWSNALIAVMTASELAGTTTNESSSHSHSLNRSPPPLMRSTAPSMAANPMET